MAEVGATLLSRASSTTSGWGRWQRSDARLIDRIRRPFVAASLMSGDFVAALAALSFSGALLELASLQPPDTSDTRLVAVPFLILTLFAVGLYSGAGPSPYERFRLRAFGVTGFVAIDLLVGWPVAEPGYLLASGICNGVCLLLFSHYVEAMMRALLINFHLWGAPTAVVGCGDKGRNLVRLLMSGPDLGLRPIGFIEIPDDRNLLKTQLPLPLIGTTADLGRDRGSRVEVAIFNSAHELAAVTSGPRAWMPNCRLLFVEDAHDIQSLWLHTRTLGGLIGIEIRRGLCARYNRVFKRMIDVLISLPIGLLACPLIAVLALAIKLVDRGPAFYVQDRIGRNGTTLRMFKLRTMYTDAEQRLEELLGRDTQARAEWERFFKLDRDPRVLSIIGRFMRRSSLDELPQLWNVLRGDMSLVGPRPFPAYHMGSFDAEFQAIRVSVRPGITGMWQVSSRSNGDLQVQKAQDLFYIRNWSIWLDIYILLQTVPAVLSAKGAK